MDGRGSLGRPRHQWRNGPLPQPPTERCSPGCQLVGNDHLKHAHQQLTSAHVGNPATGTRTECHRATARSDGTGRKRLPSPHRRSDDTGSRADANPRTDHAGTDDSRTHNPRTDDARAYDSGADPRTHAGPNASADDTGRARNSEPPLWQDRSDGSAGARHSVTKCKSRWWPRARLTDPSGRVGP